MQSVTYPGMPQAEPSTNQNSNSSHAGTIYPGMQNGAASTPAHPSGVGKPIMGFLFSVSNSPLGEYWPIYVGPNNIGRDESNAVCLREASVSASHATIVVRKMQRQGGNGGIFVFVQDTGSTCGTMLNGETLDFNPKECKTGDVITIGENYELLLILIDTESRGLAPKEGFMHTSVEQSAESQSAGWISANGIGLQAGSLSKGTLDGLQGSESQSQGYINPFESRPATIYMPNKK